MIQLAMQCSRFEGRTVALGSKNRASFSESAAMKAKPCRERSLRSAAMREAAAAVRNPGNNQHFARTCPRILPGSSPSEAIGFQCRIIIFIIIVNTCKCKINVNTFTCIYAANCYSDGSNTFHYFSLILPCLYLYLVL